MADTTIKVTSGEGKGVQIGLDDNGDGTFSVKTAATASALPSGAATSAKQDAEAVLLGAVNETAPASDTASSGLNGRLQRIAQRLTSLLPASIGQKAKAASLAVTLSTDEDTVGVGLDTGLNILDDAVMATLAAGEAHAGQFGLTIAVVSGTFTRPNDTNNYAAADAVTDSTSASTAFTIANAARVSAGSGTILGGGRLAQSSTVANAAGYRLHLYISTPSSIPNDNTAMTLLNANNAARLGFIDFIAQRTGSDVIEFYATEKEIPFKLGSGTSLLGVLETLGAITTPTALTVYTVYLPIAQN